MKLIFCMLINITVFCKLSFFEGFGQVRPNYRDKLELSLQYIEKEVRNEVHFFHAGKHQSFSWADSIIFDLCSQACQKTKNNKFLIS